MRSCALPPRRHHEPDERAVTLEVGVRGQPHHDGAGDRRRDGQRHRPQRHHPSAGPQGDPPDHELLDGQQDDDEGEKVGRQQGGDGGELGGVGVEGDRVEEYLRGEPICQGDDGPSGRADSNRVGRS